MRVGVIGTGFGAAVVAPTFANTEGCTVVDVVSPRDEAAVVSLCKRTDVDMISVQSPPFLHERNVMTALSAGHAVMCDKPFGLNAQEAERMLRAAREAGVVHLVNFQFRHEPWRRAVRELIVGGVLGDIEFVEWLDHGPYWRALGPGWHFDAAAGGGWIGASVSHAVDTLRWWVGDVAVESGVLTRAGSDQARADDGGSFTFSTKGGGLCTLVTTSMAAHAVGSRLVIAGDRATVERTTGGVLVLTGADWRADQPPTFPGDADSFGLAMASWFRQVRDAVMDGDAGGVPTFADGLACATVLDAIRQKASVVDRY